MELKVGQRHGMLKKFFSTLRPEYSYLRRIHLQSERGSRSLEEVMLSHRKFSVTAAIWGMLVFIPVLAQAENNRSIKRILPEHDLSVVCLENPYSENWLEIDAPGIRRPTIYSILKQDEDVESREVVRLRLLVQGQPCYFEFSSTSTSGIGTLQDTSGVLPTQEIEGLELPLVFPENAQHQIVQELLRNCRETTLIQSTFPFEPFDDCGVRISNVLLLYSTSILVLGTTPSDEKLRVDFVFGRPFLDGKEIELW